MKEELVHKVTLGSGKVVLVRDFKIKHLELAIQAAGTKAGDNDAHAGFLRQNEMLKILIVQIDGKEVDRIKLEDLDSLFDFQEYQQLLQVVEQLSGVSENKGKFQIEVCSIGGK